MTAIQKAIFTEIKNHNTKDSGYLLEFNNRIKFLGMSLYNKEGYPNFTICSDGAGLTRYLVECSFKPEQKGNNDIVMYQVNIYSDGSMSIFFDGTRYSK